MFTGASDNFRLSGIEEDINNSGQPSAINRVLILNAEPHPGRGTVLLLREAIGF